MFKKFTPLTLLPFALAVSLTTAASAETSDKQIVVAPTCLAKNISGDFKILASTTQFNLIETNDAGIAKLIEAKTKQKTRCGGFINVTDDYETLTAKKSVSTDEMKKFLAAFTTQQTLATKNTSYNVNDEAHVKYLIGAINPSNMWNDLTKLTSFKDRYANSDNGVKAVNWIKTQIDGLAAAHIAQHSDGDQRNDVTTYFIATGKRYKQSSLVVKFGEGTGPGIVIGAHMDTLDSNFSKKPGADDDGSGTVTALETARVILSSGMHFSKPIYFIWYAAEEEGLVGSGYVVKDFKAKKIPVDAVLHMDMTGYAHENDPTMWLMTDYVDPNLTNYLETLINTYVKQPVKRSRCGYACSDHATWNQNGYPAAIAFEASYETMNPDIHTTNDTMGNLSLAHMTDYAKLGVAFAAELAGVALTPAEAATK